MIRSLAVIAMLAATPATAAECTLANAIYAQAGTAWELRFHPVPHDAAVNQVNAFSLAVPGTELVIDGGVYVPNGFTSAWGSMDIGCPDGGDEPGCQLWEGTIYGLGASGLDELEAQDAAPPLQVLIPEFASTLWYSAYPGVELRDVVPKDAFTFRGCAE